MLKNLPFLVFSGTECWKNLQDLRLLNIGDLYFSRTTTL